MKHGGPIKRRTALKAKKGFKKRTISKAAVKRRKRGEWGTPHADNQFSLFIRERDGKCLKCGTKDNLTCSHYHRRGHSATRFDPKNCITLCKWCHAEWEGPKIGYTQFMVDWLGQEEFIALSLRAGSIKPRKEAVAECKIFLQQQAVNATP